LFNNAGAPTPGSLSDVTLEQIESSMRLLVGSVLIGIKHAARVMDGRGGNIINNSSIAAIRSSQGGYLYSIAKAAVTHATRLAAVQLGDKGIRVNSISPGAIATPIYWGGSAADVNISRAESERKQRKLEDSLIRASPLGLSGLGRDIAEAAAFLASDGARFITGHDLVVDGGRIWAYNEKKAPQ
jgi:NAD(P)-dependent dehydrogenase (short-subunit alcohol dehydrogenase family)